MGHTRLLKALTLALAGNQRYASDTAYVPTTLNDTMTGMEADINFRTVHVLEPMIMSSEAINQSVPSAAAAGSFPKSS